MSIDKDDWTNWAENPITQAFFAKIGAEIERTREHWFSLAWGDGNLDEREYAYHKARVNALEYMQSLDYEDVFEAEDDDGS